MSDGIEEAVWALQNELSELYTTIPTRREMFAALAMHGLMTTGALDSPSFTAEQAVKYADALIAGLDKDVGGPPQGGAAERDAGSPVLHKTSTIPCPCCDVNGRMAPLSAFAFGVAVGQAFDDMHAITELMCADHRSSYLMAMAHASVVANSVEGGDNP